MSEPIDVTPALRQVHRRHGRLRFHAVRAVERVARGLGGRALYRRTRLTRGRFLVREERLEVPGLPRGLEGFRIVQLSDLHAGPFLREGDLADVVAVANELEPGLAVLTGDLITRGWREALLPLGDLARLEARHGVLGVFGNHDYRDRREGEIARAYAEHGIEFLRNQCRRIDTGDGVLGVVGLEDLEESKRLDLAGARAGLEPGDVELVLCHNPAGAPQLARPGCVAVLAGHTHGSQVDLPMLRRAGPPHPGTRLELGPTTLIVNRGLGVIGLPLRIGAPTELVLVELRGAAA